MDDETREELQTLAKWVGHLTWIAGFALMTAIYSLYVTGHLFG